MFIFSQLDVHDEENVQVITEEKKEVGYQETCFNLSVNIIDNEK